MESVSSRLKIAMEIRGINQVQLARISGINQGRITNITTGKTRDPQGTTIAKLCQALEVNPFWLIMGWGNMDTEERLKKEDTAGTSTKHGSVSALEM